MSASTRMPFGRYKGYQLRDIDTDYLYWLVKKVACSPGLLLDVRAELALREARAYGGYANPEQSGCAQAPARLPTSVTIEAAMEIISAGRRAAAKRHHPDVGGNTSTMSSVNATCDWLEEQIRLLFEGVRA